MAKVKSVSHLHVTLLSISAILLSTALLFNYLNKSDASSDNFIWNKEVNKVKCEAKGNPIINVTQKVVKTVDSGEGGNNWAFDDLNRQIKVYKISENTFCAITDNEGRFDSQAGQTSPGNTGTLTGDEDGSFQGGYRALIVGSLKTTPSAKTSGNLGSINYNCDLGGNCPGYLNWVDQYFAPGYAFSYEWWGWEYKYKSLKWINSSDGNSGDII